LISVALLTATALRLFRLPDATIGFVGRLTDLAHVVAILNHVLPAEAAFVSILCHDKTPQKLFKPRTTVRGSCSHFGEQKSTETLSIRCRGGQ
jgi:hypothetical protein